MSKVNNILVLLFAILMFQLIEAKAKVCEYWKSRTDFKTQVDFEIDETKPKNIIVGINCLLKLEGNKNEGFFSGVVKNTVSQTFPQATVEVCALYYISYLFYQNFQHANAVAIIGKDRSFNSDENVKKAYKSYKIWFKKLKKIGLQKARKQKLDPLKYSGVNWY